VDEAPEQLGNNEIQEINSAIGDLQKAFDNNCGEWRAKHDLNINGWFNVTLHPSRYIDVIFQYHTDFVLKYYGLEVWMSHVQNIDHFGHISHASISYLTFPTPAKAKVWKHLEEEVGEQGMCYTCHDKDARAVETGFALPVAMPQKPSKASLSRFPRAMKMLDLDVRAPEYEDPFEQVMASGEDSEDDSSAAKECGWPQLTLLTRSSWMGVKSCHPNLRSIRVRRYRLSSKVLREEQLHCHWRQPRLVALPRSAIEVE